MTVVFARNKEGVFARFQYPDRYDNLPESDDEDEQEFDPLPKGFKQVEEPLAIEAWEQAMTEGSRNG